MKRLEILRFMKVHPGRKVSEIAEALAFSLPETSRSLRILNSRGLLRVRRRGAEVYYSIGADPQVPHARNLLRGLAASIDEDDVSLRRVFRAMTAFTHPRRIQIVRMLDMRPRTWGEIRGALGMTKPAAHRHLAKLENRGFTEYTEGHYRIRTDRKGIDRILLGLAIRDPAV